MRRIGIWCATGLVLLAAAPSEGGWAVTTLHTLPLQLEAGRATRLTFTIRQHGVEPLAGRAPTVFMRREGARWFERSQRFTAADRGRGVYEAVVTPEAPGAVHIVIDADFHGAESRLLPLRVVAMGTAPAVPAAHERGQALYAAKGCVSCHRMIGDDAFADFDVIEIAPALGQRAFPAGAIEAQLRNPRTMPRLELDDAEIAALVAYLM